MADAKVVGAKGSHPALGGGTHGAQEPEPLLPVRGDRTVVRIRRLSSRRLLIDSGDGGGRWRFGQVVRLALCDV